MAQYDGTIKIDTALDEAGLVNGLTKLKKLGGTAAKALGAAAAATGTAMIAFGKQSVETGMQFDSSMSQVAATMGTTVDQIQDLRDFAQEMGSKTAFSATQAAEGMNILAMAGYDAEQQISVLPSVLNLAAAGGLDLAQSADYVTGILSGFSNETLEAATVADTLAQISSSAKGDVQSFGEGLSTVAGMASTTGQKMQDMTVALGILGNNNYSASEAGDALSRTLKNLYQPTSSAQDAMDALGVSAYDAEENARPLQDVLIDLNQALDGMSDQQKNNVLSDIFDAATLKSVPALLNNATTAWDDLQKKVASGLSLGSVVTSEGIAEMQQHFSDLYEKFGGDTEAFSKEARAYLEETFDLDEEIVTGAIDTFVDSMQSGITSADELQEALAKSGSAAQAMADTQLDNLAGDITLFQSALEGAQIAVSDALTPALREFVQFGSQGISELTEAFKSGDFGAVVDTFEGILTDGLNMLIEKLPQFISVGTDILLALVGGIVAVLPTLGTAAVEIINNLASGIADALPALIPAAYEAVMGFMMALTDPANLGSLVDGAISLIMGLADGLINALPILIENAPVIIENLATALIENTPKLLDAALEITLALAEGLITNLPTILAAQGEIFAAILGALWDFAGTLLSWLGELGGNILSAIGSWLAEMIVNIVAFIADLSANIQTFLSDLPNKIGYALGKIIQFGVSALNWAITMPPKIIQSVVTWFMTLPGRLANALGRAVTSVIQFGVSMKEKATSAAKNTATGIIDSFTSLPGKLADIGGNIVKGLWKGINDMKNWVINKVKGFGDSVLAGLKKALGINSPSKITAGYGGYLAQGLNLGFQKEMPKVRNGLLSDIKGMTAQMRAVVSLESGRLAANVSGGGNVTNSTVTHNTTYNPTLNIYQPVQSPAQVRRAMRKAMEMR